MRISISKAFMGLSFVCMLPATGLAAEKSYLCAINEVYECMAVTGCSRISLADANLAGLMLLDVEKKQLTSIATGQDPNVDDIEGVTVNDEAILLRSTRGKDRAWSGVINLETGSVSASVSTPDSTLSLSGYCSPKP